MRLEPHRLIEEIERNHARIVSDLAEVPIESAICILEQRIVDEAQRVLGNRTAMDTALRAAPDDSERRAYTLTNMYAHLQIYPSHGTIRAKIRRMQEYRWFREGIAS